MTKKTFFILGSIALLLLACNAETTQSTPGIQLATVTPEITILPTREGAPNLAGETIHLYHLCASSGPNAEANEVRIKAAADLAAYINESGGVFGAELLLETVDLSSDPASAVASFERTLRLNESAFLFLLCDRQGELAIAPLLEENNVVGIGPGQASAQTYIDAQNLFSPNPVPEAHFSFWLDVLETHWNEIKPSGSDAQIRLAVLSASPEFLANIPLDSLGKERLEFVFQAEVDEENSTDVFGLVYDLRDANANAIYLDSNGKNSANIVNALHALGLRERFFVFGPSAAYELGFAGNLFDQNYASGVSFSAAYHWWSSSAADMAEELLGNPEQNQAFRNGAYLAGLQALDMAVQAIEEAIIANDFQNLSSETIIQYLQNSKNSDLILAENGADMLETVHTYNQLIALTFLDDYLQSRELTGFIEISDIEILISEE